MSIRIWATLIAVVSILSLLTATHVKAYRAGAASARHAILTRSVEIPRERSRIDDEVPRYG